MKFTLYPNDELKFKIKQRWDFSAPEVLIINSYCYRQIKYLIASIKNFKKNLMIKNSLKKLSKIKLRKL